MTSFRGGNNHTDQRGHQCKDIEYTDDRLVIRTQLFDILWVCLEYHELLADKCQVKMNVTDISYRCIMNMYELLTENGDIEDPVVSGDSQRKREARRRRSGPQQGRLPRCPLLWALFNISEG